MRFPSRMIKSTLRVGMPGPMKFPLTNTGFTSRFFTDRPAPKSETTTKDFISMSSKSTILFLLSGTALLSYFFYQKSVLEHEREQSKTESHGKPLVGGPFVLVDTNGQLVSDKTYLGKYLLIYFGYTFCPDVCPEELEKMALITDKINAKHNDKVLPIFISCDPKRDSLKIIKEYIKEFHPKFIGLTGTFNQIKKVAKQYRLYFSAPPRALDDDDSDYLVDHSIFFYLVGEDGKFIEHFGRNDSPEDVAEKILSHINK